MPLYFDVFLFHSIKVDSISSREPAFLLVSTKNTESCQVRWKNPRFADFRSFILKSDWLTIENEHSAYAEQAAISKRNSVSFPDRGRIRMTRNFLICPYLAPFRQRRRLVFPCQQIRHTRKASYVFVCARKRSHWWEFSSSQNIARMFT